MGINKLQNINICPQLKPFQRKHSGITYNKALDADVIKFSTKNVTFKGGSQVENSLLVTTAAYLWAGLNEKLSPNSFVIGGHVEELKALKKDGVTFIFAPKHYDQRDIPGLMKLFYYISPSRKEFKSMLPHTMKAVRSDSLQDRVLAKLDKGLGSFLVDTSGKGKGRKALVQAIDLINNKEHITIFPEGGSGLKYKGQPVSSEKQTFQSIKNGLAHIVTRLIESNKVNKNPKDLKVAVIPIGISGEAVDKSKPASLFVGKPIMIFNELKDSHNIDQELPARLKELNEYFQPKLQETQDNAYNLYLDSL